MTLTRGRVPVATTVYLVAEEGDDTYLKIGVTSSDDVRARVAGLQTGNRRKLIIRKTFQGTMSTEQGLHRWFSDRRVSGEWFHFPEGDGIEKVTALLLMVAGHVEAEQAALTVDMTVQTPVAEAWRMRESGASLREIAEVTGISKSRLGRLFNS